MRFRWREGVLIRPGGSEVFGWWSMYYKACHKVPQDTGEAAKWCSKSAAQGDHMAQGVLCIMYYTGEGIPRDYIEAAK